MLKQPISFDHKYNINLFLLYNLLNLFWTFALCFDYLISLFILIAYFFCSSLTWDMICYKFNHKTLSCLSFLLHFMVITCVLYAGLLYDEWYCIDIQQIIKVKWFYMRNNKITMNNLRIFNHTFYKVIK